MRTTASCSPAVTLVMSASYAVLGVAVRRRVPDDERSVLAFFALSVMFATLAAPLALASNATTLVWAAEGAVLVVLGYLYAYPPLRVGGLALHVLAVCRLFLLHFPTTAQDVPLLLNARVAIAAFTCAAVAAAAVVHHVWREQATRFDAPAKLSLGLGSGVLALLVLHAELGRWLALRASGGSLSNEYWYFLSGRRGLGGGLRMPACGGPEGSERPGPAFRRRGARGRIRHGLVLVRVRPAPTARLTSRTRGSLLPWPSPLQALRMRR